jgi:hypothetical protein
MLIIKGAMIMVLNVINQNNTTTKPLNQNRMDEEQKEIILLGSKEEILNKYTDYDGIIDRSQALIAMQEYAELYYLAKTKKQTFKSE